MSIYWIVLDSAGIGDAADAEQFGDAGSNTWKRCYDTGKLEIPNMEKLGIYHIDGMNLKSPGQTPAGCYGRLEEKSLGKDTTIGHWEMAGLITNAPFPTYPHGFPREVMEKFEQLTGCGTLCNLPYSGSEVICDYGEEHLRTGKLIIYTSADSVFQIAAHEDKVSVKKLYEYCQIARDLLQGEHAVARVIARPFVGTYPDYVRTDRRHDFSLQPGKDTILDQLGKNGIPVQGIGKIYDIFAGKGVSQTIPNHGNKANMEEVFRVQKSDFQGLCYVNLVDFDMLYGHRRDIPGYTNALNEFDKQLGTFMDQMKEKDILFITADHGCDPGFQGTDHTRENVPLLCYGKALRENVNLGKRGTFADIAATVGALFQISYDGDGSSFAEEILK
ncbi:MAG: phosphopentomutase [Lachnospiraceae bacterium]|nr:phosphopentomutase [Lachnospiraceae bacterium]